MRSEEVSPGQTTLQSELEKGLCLTMLPETSALSVDARWNRGADEVESSVDLVLNGGFVRLEADRDGSLRLDDFSLEIDDIVVESELLHTTIELTEVSIAQTREATTVVAGWDELDGHLEVELTLGLELSWSLRLEDGSVVPLAGQELVEFPLQLQLAMDSRGVYAGFEVYGDGALWNWANVVEIYGLQLDLRADEQGPIE